MHLNSNFDQVSFQSALVHVPNFGGLSGSEDRSGGDNSIQFINFGRVSDKNFEKMATKNRGVEGWVTTIFDFFVLLY